MAFFGAGKIRLSHFPKFGKILIEIRGDLKELREKVSGSGSLVGIATDYGLNGPGIDAR
jgi:hypothetical protein